MMDRAQKLAILNAASDESLDSALGAIGVTCGGYDEYGEGESGPDSQLATWADLDVSIPSTHRGPIADKGALFKMAKSQKPKQHDALGLQLPGAEEDEMLSAGLM